MPLPVKDVIINNGFYIEFPSVLGIESPHFTSVDGLGVDVANVEFADGGSNTVHKRSSGLYNATELTLTRPLQNNDIDDKLMTVYNECAMRGRRFDVTLIKLHYGSEAFRYVLKDFSFTKVSNGTLSTDGTEKLEQTFTATILEYYKI